MFSIKADKFFPCITGFSVGFTFGAAFNSFVFNSIAWYLSGDGQTFENMYTVVPTFPFYTQFAFIISVAAYTMAGFVTAKLSKSQPYYNAMLTGIIYLAWLIYLQVSSPLKVVSLEFLTILLWVLVIPFAIFGSHIWAKNNG